MIVHHREYAIVVYCTNCKQYYQKPSPGQPTLSCAVAHGHGDCFHYGDKELVKKISIVSSMEEKADV